MFDTTLGSIEMRAEDRERWPRRITGRTIRGSHAARTERKVYT